MRHEPYALYIMAFSVSLQGLFSFLDIRNFSHYIFAVTIDFIIESKLN
jgi:hypothetical protein